MAIPFESLERPASRGLAEQRQIEIQGEVVAYRLVRSAARRSIGLSIDRQGLRVGAPSAIRLVHIENLLRQQGGWIRDKLTLWRAHAFLLEADAACLWLGQPHILRRAFGRASQCHDGQLELAARAGEADLGAAFIRWCKARARPLFLSRLAHYAGRLGVPTPPLILSSAKSRWGSCNAKGEIRLSWRLMQFDPQLIDYVVAHEIAHLREMNHSPRFWAIVAQLYPDWRAARQTIRRLARQLPQLE
ncbi:MAG: M48 family metallopeptidase [Zoogloeaceae bacterium]|jgi:predicted metal-dependent hydrolase|nr:M48 family metallopeptidase [Zoogloeaceae bacterium]